MSLLKQITKPSEKTFTRLNRRVITFLVCLLISVFSWLLMTLSKEYTETLSFPVSYVNLPKDKVISNQLPGTIDIEIRTTGFNLLKYRLRSHRETILIDIKDVKRFKSHHYLLTSSKTDKITRQLHKEIKILRITPDSLFFNFNKKVTKTVPVRSNLTINFDNHYQQTDSIKLTPSSIDVAGAAEAVKKINYLETVPVSLNNVANSQSLQLKILMTPDLKELELSRSMVQAEISVTKYTEASIELPIEVENLPSGYSLKTFPDKISVKYNVAFNDYERINALQFRAFVDYKKIEAGNNKLKVNLVKFPSEIRAIKINPEKVEYIIRK